MNRIKDLLESISKFDNTETPEIKSRYFDIIQKDASMLVDDCINNVSKIFTSEEELRNYIQTNMPIAIKPSRPSKYKFINPFTSNYACNEIVDSIVKCLLK